MGLNAGIRRLTMHYYFYTVDKLMAIVTYLSNITKIPAGFLRKYMTGMRIPCTCVQGIYIAAFFSL
jgi:hypothetical protein